MPLDESLLQRFGGLSLPGAEDSTDDTLTSLDPARDTLLALFAAAINSELGAAWTAVTATLGANHRLYGTSPVQDTLPMRPTEQLLSQRKTGWPVLMLHRDGRGEFSDHGLELDKLTQPWKLHWVVGPLDIIDQRKMLDIGQAIAKVLRLVIRKRGHRAYQDGALQFFGDTTPISSIDLTGYAGPDHIGFAGEASTVIFWGSEADLVTTEISADLEGSDGGNFDAIDLTLGVGGEEEILPAVVLAQSDAEPADAGDGSATVRQEVVLWAAENAGSTTAKLFGYTESQLVDGYASDPAVILDLSSITGVGVIHGFAVLRDGALAVACSEQSPAAQSEENFVFIPEVMTRISRTLTDEQTHRIACADFDGTRADTGARVVESLPDGRFVVGRDWYAPMTRRQLEGLDAVTGVVVTEPNAAGQTLGWDIYADGNGNIWQCGGQTFWRCPASAMSSGASSYVVDKIMKGSNLSASASSNTGLGGIAFDRSGGVWLSDFNSNTLKYWDAAAIDALTSTITNPAPTRSLTSAALTGAWACVIDLDGGMWVLNYVASGTLCYFTAAQLAAGGSQTPAKTVTVTIPWPLCLRLSVGNGLRQHS